MSKVNVPIAFLSLVTSTLLWASVYNAAHKKPETRDVPATLQVNNLDRQKYVVTDMPTSITIPVAGNVNQIKNVEAYAIVDLKKPEIGKSWPYPVTVFPSIIRELMVGNVTVLIKVEELARKSMELKPTYTGALPSGKRVESTEYFPKRVFITGPISAVNRIVAVHLPIDYSGAATAPDGVDVEARAVDSAGFEVTRVILRTTDSSPDYNDENLREPAKIRVHLHLENVDNTTGPPKS